MITHAHRRPCLYRAPALSGQRSGEGVLRARLGDISRRSPTVSACASATLEISLHPAGHVLGSSQVRVAHHGRVWIASGDYKVAADRTCTAFEAGAVRHLHHREHLWLCRCTAGADDAMVFAQIKRVVGGQCRARTVACSPATASARRSASWRGWMPASDHHRARRSGAVESGLSRCRCHAATYPSGQRAHRRGPSRCCHPRHGHLPPSATASPWARRFRSAGRVCQRLDATARCTATRWL